MPANDNWRRPSKESTSWNRQDKNLSNRHDGFKGRRSENHWSDQQPLELLWVQWSRRTPNNRRTAHPPDMANFAKRVAENVPGDFFVDSTCIDCDACRQIAPSVFAEATETAFVHQQPETPERRREALHALLSCPTGSIGCLGSDDPKSAMADFPLVVEEPVYYCGFNSPNPTAATVTSSIILMETG